MSQIKLKRGMKANLPSSLPLGEPAFCIDTQEMYIGQGLGKKLIKVNGTEISNILQNVDSLKETKMNKGDSILVTQIDKNKSKIDQTYLTDELLQQITGDTPIHAVPEDKSITTEKLADGSVDINKLGFVSTGKNLFDYSNLTPGYRLDVQGRLYADPSYDVSDFIPVTSGQQILLFEVTNLSFTNRICGYREDKSFIKVFDGTGSEATKVILDIDFNGYIRIPVYSARKTKVMMTTDITTTVFEPYMVSTPSYLRSGSLPKSITTEHISEQGLELDVINEFNKMSNLYNCYSPEIQMNCFLDQSNNFTSNNAYVVSHPIFVTSGQDYTITGKVRSFAIRDSFNKNIAEYFYTESGYSGETTFTPKVSGYLYLNLYASNYTNVQVEKGSISTGISEYGYSVNAKLSVPDGTIEPQKLVPKSVGAEQVDFLRKSNLINRDLFVDGYIDARGVVINDPNAYQYKTTDYIPITHGETYTSTPFRKMCFFNKDKKVFPNTLIDGSANNYTFVSKYTGYVRISYAVHNGDLERSQFEEGTELTPYGDYNNTILRENVVLPTNSVKSHHVTPNAINTNHVDFISQINLFDKDSVSLGFIEPSGLLNTNFDHYRTSALIPITKGKTYTVSKSRKIAFFDMNGAIQKDLFVDISWKVHTFTAPIDGFIRATFSSSTPEGLVDEAMIVEGSSLPNYYIPYGVTTLDENIQIPQVMKLEEDLMGIEEKIEEVKNSSSSIHVIKMDNVDRIGFIGDSYTESHYTLKGKAYINKLSLFSDYNFENFAQSGDTYRGNLNRIRKHQAIYHSKMSWTDFKPTYALLISYTNDLKYMNTEQYLNDLRAVIESVKALGAIPIVATEYHHNFGNGIQTALQGVANEYGLDFINLLPKAKALRGKDYTPFWGGSHPGTRTNHILCDQLEPYFKRMPRPFQSIKIFRPRNANATKEELIFNSNVERARKFKEIMVGHSAINNPEEYDNCTNSRNSKVTSEYLKLLNNEDVIFNNHALIDVVLPSTSHSINEIDLQLSNNLVNVYIKDTLAQPYPTPSFFQRFDFTGKPTFVKGAKYTSNDPKLGSQQFTVAEVQDGTVLMSPCSRVSSENGTLTKVSGEGDATVDYFYTAIGFSSDYPEGKLDVGHWTKINLVDGKFKVTKDLVNRCMDYDKISFLLECNGEFRFSDIKVFMDGVITKSRQTLKRSSINVLPYNAQQMLNEQFFGTSEQVAGWKKTQSTPPYVPVDKVLPVDCSGCIDITPTKIVSQTVNFTSSSIDDRKAIVRVWARYFPPIFNQATMNYPQDSHITEDTFDYAELCIATRISGKDFEVTDLVGLHWKELEFEIFVPSDINSFDLRIYSKDKDIQLAKASMYLV